MRLRKTLAPIARAVFAFGVASTIAASPASAQDASLHTLRSPSGGFTVSVPAEGNWRIDEAPASAAYPFARKIVVHNGSGLQAFFYLLLPINDLAADLLMPRLPCLQQRGTPLFDGATCFFNQLEVQAKASSKHWSGGESAKVLAYSLQASGIRVTRFSIAPAGGNRASFRGTFAGNGQPVDVLGVVTSFTFPNQVASRFWNGLPQYWTFALVAGCQAPEGALDKVVRGCVAILRSFHPQSEWVSAQEQQTLAFELQRMENGVERLVRLVGDRGIAIRNTWQASQQIMQQGFQNNMHVIEDAVKDAQGWIPAYLGVTTVHDPYLDERHTVDDKNTWNCKRYDGSNRG